MFHFHASRIAAAALAFCLLVTPAAIRAAQSEGSVAGAVIDASDGVPIADATIAITGEKLHVQTDAAGHFRIDELPSGDYQVSASHNGYQPAVSEQVHVAAASRATITLSLQRSSSQLHVIAVTASHPSEVLPQTSTFTRTVNSEELQRQGITRAGDALRTLPGVNNGITGDTAALADDINVSIRGIGTLETVATIDGHPIGYGIKGGYNFQLSPVFPFRNVQVLYGSGGSDLLGVNAIGGIVNFQTLDPTPESRFSLSQGYGTFEHLSTSATATGTMGKLGYALAYGTSGIDGPLRNDFLYQPNAAYDQSATDPVVRNLGVYRDDSSAVSRAGLAKFRYRFDSADAVTLSSVNSSYWNDKTGNGDGDYLDYAPALAFGEQLLAQKKPSDPCGAGTFTATNANGAANGSGPNGAPDGGIRCQTPQQYAAFNTGWQGSGTSWQSFALNDEDLSYRHDSATSSQTLDFFTSRYANNVDRRFNLPFRNKSGDNGNSRLTQVTTSGVIVGDTLFRENNDFGFGVSYLNNAYLTRAVNRSEKATLSSPVDSETAYYLRDAYHPTGSRLSAFAHIWAKRARATNTSYLDPRIALVYNASPRDVIRASYGATTTQPSADMIGAPFIEAPPGGAGGGASITCSGLNSIGSAPSSLLQPERGVDEELAYAHHWHDDTQTQLSLYGVSVFNKLYSTIVPLSQTGTAFIDPAYLASVTAQIAGKCGAGAASSLLGLTGNFNVGTLRANGADFSGRYRFTRRLFFDYDWALTSTVLLGANTSLLEANQTLILNGQIPRVPLHTFTGALDATFGNRLNVRYMLHTVSINNTKALPAYDYSDIRFAYPFRNSTISMTVSNLFDQWADIRGLRYEGVPLPLNGYATAASYANYTGANATEQFALPYRSVYFSCEFRM